MLMPTVNALAPHVLILGEPKFGKSRLATLASPTPDFASLPSGRELAGELGAIGGAFALAWREPGGRCVLAVDRFASRSLCWRLDAGQLRFAARADELAGADAEIDPQAIFDYLLQHVIPAPRTIYRGVHRLPAAHLLQFVDGRIEQGPWWQPHFETGEKLPFDEQARRFRGLLQDSVASELGTGKPACYLSGGTDSSTVAGMIRQATGQRPSSYSIGFDAEGYDEMAYARIAARHFDTDHHEYYVTPADLVAAMPMVAAAYDQPFGNSSAVPAYCCAKMARDDGVAKILAGDGGDELFGGNVRYAKQRVFALYQRLPTALRRGLLEPAAGLGAIQRTPLLRKAASYVNQARVPMPARVESYNLLTRLGVADVLEPAFAAAVDAGAPAALQQQVWDAAPAHTFIDRQLVYDWRFTLAENDLPKVVGTTALAGIDVGFPLLSPGLVDFSATLPASYKLRGLKLRWFFKEALRGFLPDEILQKKKHGFGLPFGVWATRDAPLRALASDALRSLATRGIVREAFVRRLLDEHLLAHPGYYGEMVWILTMLELWLQKRAPNYRLA